MQARLLGIPLLRLEATVVLVPAGISGPARVRPSRGSAKRSRMAGGDLADAVRRIDEGAKVLAEVSRNGA